MKQYIMQRNAVYKDTVYADTTYHAPNYSTTKSSSWGSTIKRKLRLGKSRPKSEHIEIRRSYSPRYDSIRPGFEYSSTELPPGVEEELLRSPWYQKGVPREIALDMLNQQEIGSFVVRESTSHKGCFALSVKVPKFDNPMGISHYLITRTHLNTYRLKGVDKEWPSLTALVTHHTVMPEMLPCTLRLPRPPEPTNISRGDDGRPGAQGGEEDYQRLSDFSAMMTDLKM